MSNRQRCIFVLRSSKEEVLLSIAREIENTTGLDLSQEIDEDDASYFVVIDTVDVDVFILCMEALDGHATRVEAVLKP